MTHPAFVVVGVEHLFALGVGVAASAVRTHSGRIFAAVHLVAEETFQAIAAHERTLLIANKNKKKTRFIVITSTRIKLF